MQRGLDLHRAGDWGEVDDERRRDNEHALLNAERVVSVHRSSKGIAFWIVTNWDRTETTIFIPKQD